MKPTREEIEYERQYRYNERLGMLCENREPTPQQMAIARKEADDAIKILYPTETKPKTP